MRRELFKAYHGRYTFDVDKAYDLIKQDKIKYEEVKLNSRIAQSLIFFTGVHSDHLSTKDVESEEADGLMVKFSDPDHGEDTMIIDGNHRINAKIRAAKPFVKLIYVKNPNDVKKFLTIDKKIPKKLFLDDDEILENLIPFEKFANNYYFKNFELFEEYRINEGVSTGGIKAYYSAICSAEGITEIPLKFGSVKYGGAATTYDARTMKPLYISFDLSRMMDPEHAVLHEITHQIKLQKEGNPYIGKKDQSASFQKLQASLFDKYMYSTFSKLLWNSK